MNDPLSSSGLVIVDKQAGMTSHDVVSKLRKIFQTRKVGHAGTLDPMATGVLVAGLERGTKFLAHLVATTKAYDATIRLGQATTTDDAEGDVVSHSPVDGLSSDAVHRAVDSLTGDIMQRPASVSAIKIDGKRAYARVREGEEVEIPERPVTVSRFEVHSQTLVDGFLDLEVSVHCSSGTYIRSLARDLGEILGVGGHLTALRRTEVGPWSLGDAATLEQLAEQPELSLTLDEALPRSYPIVDVTDQEAADLATGKWLEPRGLEGVHAAVTPDGRAVALIREQGDRLATVFVARPVTLL